jgi:hypothetical protein
MNSSSFFLATSENHSIQVGEENYPPYDQVFSNSNFILISQNSENAPTFCSFLEKNKPQKDGQQAFIKILLRKQFTYTFL